MELEIQLGCRASKQQLQQHPKVRPYLPTSVLPACTTPQNAPCRDTRGVTLPRGQALLMQHTQALPATDKGDGADSATKR